MQTSRVLFASKLCKVAAVIVGLIGLALTVTSAYIYYTLQSETSTNPNIWVNIFLSLTLPAVTGIITSIFSAVILYAAGMALEAYFAPALEDEELEEDEDVEILPLDEEETKAESVTR